MKKILFSILGLFTLFLINTNVYAAPSAMEYLYLSEPDYLELIENFEVNYLNNYLDVVDFDWTFNNRILVSRTIWKNGELEKNYHLLFYDEITNQTYNNGRFVLYCRNFMDVILDENGNILSLFDGRGINTMAGSFIFDINNLLYENTFQQHYSYNIVFSNIGFALYSDYSSKNELVLFYDPINNHSKNITKDDLTTDLDNKYNDYVGDTGENLSWFEKIVNGIINIPNTISKFFDNLISNMVNLFIDLTESIGNLLSNLGNFIINGIKTLFVPSDDFFTKWFDKIDNMMSAQFGFLYSSFNLIIDFIESFYTLEETEAIINIPNIKEPISDTIIINATSINLTSIFNSNATLSLLYNLYTTYIFAWVAFALINYGRKVFLNI